MLVVRGHDYDDWKLAALQLPDHIEAAHPRHLEVEENNIRLEPGDLTERLLSVLGFSYDFNILDLLKFLPKHLAGNRLVVTIKLLIKAGLIIFRISQYPAEDE
jgi:hypothetical protein